MAIRDYICCKSCGCKFIYDGYYSIRDELDASYGTCDLICPSCLDELEVKLAKLEQAQQEPAQAVPYAWHVPPMTRMYFGEYAQIDAEAEARHVGGTAKAIALYTAPPAISEPAQAVPVAWRTFDGEGGYEFRSYDENETYQDDFIKSNGAKYSGWVEPLYTHRAPLDSDTRKMVLELCELTLINAGPYGMVTAAMKQRAEKIQESLGVGGKHVEEELKGVKTAFTESELRAVYDRLGTVQDKPKHGRQA